MTILCNGEEIGSVLTNHSMTLEEAIYYGLGIDVYNQEDCKRAYEEKRPYAYYDDAYQIDTENMDIIAD